MSTQHARQCATSAPRRYQVVVVRHANAQMRRCCSNAISVRKFRKASVLPMFFCLDAHTCRHNYHDLQKKRSGGDQRGPAALLLASIPRQPCAAAEWRKVARDLRQGRQFHKSDYCHVESLFSTNWPSAKVDSERE